MSRMLTTTEIEGKRSLIFCRDERVTRQSANREARFPISRRVASPRPRSVVFSVGIWTSATRAHESLAGPNNSQFSRGN